MRPSRDERAAPQGSPKWCRGEDLNHANPRAVISDSTSSLLWCFFKFLSEVSRRFRRGKIKILNIDCVLLSESPKIAGAVGRMKEKIARELKILPSSIGIKASTNEGMGFIGKKEGMACSAVALIQT